MAVVVVGVVAYTSLSSRISSSEEELQKVLVKSQQLKEETDRLREFGMKAQEDIRLLAEKHNNLSADFYRSQLDLPRLISFTAETSSKLAVIGWQLEEGIRKWKDGRISSQLLQALNVTLPCGERCPLRLAEPLSWTRDGTTLTLIIVAALVDMDRHSLDAEPFTLTEDEGNQTCYYKYEGVEHVSVMKNETHNCSLTVTENVYETLLTSTGKQPCSHSESHPWIKKECRANAKLMPDIKRLGATNIIYCRGMTIEHGGLPKVPCPKFAFTLSVKQSFLIGNYSFTGMETTINSNQEVNMHLQNKVNTQLHPGLDPYNFIPKSGDIDLSKSLVRVDMIIDSGKGWIIMITALTLVAVVLIVFITQSKGREGKKDKEKEKVDQEEATGRKAKRDMQKHGAESLEPVPDL